MPSLRIMKSPGLHTRREHVSVANGISLEDNPWRVYSAAE